VEGDEADSGERGGELGLGLEATVGASSDWIRCSDLTKSSTRESRASQLTRVESMADWFVLSLLLLPEEATGSIVGKNDWHAVRAILGSYVTAWFDRSTGTRHPCFVGV
jgi:hypothetical protein